MDFELFCLEDLEALMGFTPANVESFRCFLLLDDLARGGGGGGGVLGGGPASGLLADTPCGVSEPIRGGLGGICEVDESFTAEKGLCWATPAVDNSTEASSLLCALPLLKDMLNAADFAYSACL